MDPQKEGAQTGIALDGSGSMGKLYGQEGGSRVLSPIFGGPKKPTNEVTPVAQKICAYLARNIDADGGTTCIYWAVGPGGSEIEVIGDLTADQAERHIFGPPHDFGTGTQLLPAVRYFVERFKDAPWGFYVFITDGELHDLDEVIAYSKRLAREVVAGRRNPLKFVLIGVGAERQRDADGGTGRPGHGHRHRPVGPQARRRDARAREIFAEVVDKNARVSRPRPHPRPAGEGRQGLRLAGHAGVPGVRDARRGGVLHAGGQRRAHQPGRSATPSSRPRRAGHAAGPCPAGHAEAEAGRRKRSRRCTTSLPIDLDRGEWKSLPLEFGTETKEKSDLDLDPIEGQVSIRA